MPKVVYTAEVLIADGTEPNCSRSSCASGGPSGMGLGNGLGLKVSGFRVGGFWNLGFRSRLRELPTADTWPSKSKKLKDSH